MRRLGSIELPHHLGERPKHEKVLSEACIALLNSVWGTRYYLDGAPDEETRHKRAADFRFREIQNGPFVLVEFVRCVVPAAAEMMRSLRNKGQAKAVPPATLCQQGLSTLKARPTGTGIELTWDMESALGSIKNRILGKVGHGQLEEPSAFKRVLLVDFDLWLSDAACPDYEIDVPLLERQSVDHAIGIADLKSAWWIW